MAAADDYAEVEFATPEEKAAFYKWVEDLRVMVENYKAWQTQNDELRVVHSACINHFDNFRTTYFIDGIPVDVGGWTQRLNQEDMFRILAMAWII